jgi:hypothetical protein
MQRPPPTEAEKQARLFGRRSTDRPDLAQIFTAPFAAQVASIILGPETNLKPKSYAPRVAPVTGRLKDQSV